MYDNWALSQLEKPAIKGDCWFFCYTDHQYTVYAEIFERFIHKRRIIMTLSKIN